MNQARVLHEASQLAIKGKKVLVACPSISKGLEFAKQLLGSVALDYLLYSQPCECAHEPTGRGWSARFKKQGEVFFSPCLSIEDRYFDYYFALRSIEEIRKELKDQGLLTMHLVYGYGEEEEVQESIPLGWESAKSLDRDKITILSRYRRILSGGLL